jgi:hypothetical protein
VIEKEEFWNIIAAYNRGIWPVQLVLYAAALAVAILLFLKPGRIQSMVAKIYFAICFAWTGVMFYILPARDMAGGSYGNYFFGVLFVSVSSLFVLDVFKEKMQFSLGGPGWRQHTAFALVVLVLCYPLLGLALGSGYQSLIFPGTFPCPTIALALSLFTTSLPRVDRRIYTGLLFCAIPFTPFFQIGRYGVYEDVILLATGIYSLILLVRYWKPRTAIGQGK